MVMLVLCLERLIHRVLYLVVFLLIANNSSVSVVTIKSTAVKRTTLSLSGVFAGWRRRLEEHVAMCHMLRPCGPLGTCFHPQGTRPAKTAGLFWRSVGRDRADMGVQGGGWGYRWAEVDGGQDIV